MKNSSPSQKMVDEIFRIMVTERMTRDEVIRALLLVMLADFRSSHDKEHNLHDGDGVLLINVRSME